MFEFFIAITAAVLGPADVERDGVRIQTRVQANDYVYEVSNLSAEPIVRFEVEQAGTYLHRTPEGWSFEDEAGIFRAWADDPQAAIQRNQTGEFSLRASSTGAVLGEVTLRLGLQSGDELVLPEVWGIVPEPRGSILSVPLVIAGLILVHTVVLARRRQSNAQPAASDA